MHQGHILYLLFLSIPKTGVAERKQAKLLLPGCLLAGNRARITLLRPHQCEWLLWLPADADHPQRAPGRRAGVRLSRNYADEDGVRGRTHMAEGVW